MSTCANEIEIMSDTTFKRCSESFKRFDYTYEYPLSAVESVRRKRSSGTYPGINVGYMRECDAVSNITILDPKNEIKSLHLKFNMMIIDCSKSGSDKWDIESWFTNDLPLLNLCMPWMVDYMMIQTKQPSDDDLYYDGASIVITWNQINFTADKRQKIMGKYHALEYPGGLKIIYNNGTAVPFQPGSKYVKPASRIIFSDHLTI